MENFDIKQEIVNDGKELLENMPDESNADHLLDSGTAKASVVWMILAYGLVLAGIYFKGKIFLLTSAFGLFFGYYIFCTKNKENTQYEYNSSSRIAATVLVLITVILLFLDKYALLP
ncbi:MAG: hypothetical protein HUU50_06165 [Candidatus Brocadiae bacterium]|nr:hypothetical protein [Candidatus Brocadiia bacterium]